MSEPMTDDDDQSSSEVTEAEHAMLAEAADEYEMLAAAEMDRTEEQAEAQAEADAFNRYRPAEPAPDPDLALHRLIAKHGRMVSDGDHLKAKTLMWELLHRDAQTIAGHQGKLQMISRCQFEAADMVHIAWRLGVEAGRLGLSSSMPGFLTR
jgi:hypothetical protein